jgi:hypothetical protein
MVVNNLIIITGNEKEMEVLTKNCFLEGRWKTSSSKKGFKTKIIREFEFPNYRLKEISKDYSNVKLIYYYFIEKPCVIISYKVFENGEIIDQIIWKENNIKNDERAIDFAKRFFVNTRPFEYDLYFKN